MARIELEKITDKQKLIIRTGIYPYVYILKHHRDDDDDFRSVYYDFYLKSRSAVFSKYKYIKANEDSEKKERTKIENPNWNYYFDLLYQSKGTESIETIVKELHDNLTSKSFEFSFASKLLHTKNSSLPIYDSKVRKYLKEAYDKEFKTESKVSYENINSDWEMLKNWYKEFLTSPEASRWIEWFDSEFATIDDKEIKDIKEMSSYKKIDSIIFACSG